LWDTVAVAVVVVSSSITFDDNRVKTGHINKSAFANKHGVPRPPNPMLTAQ